MLELLLLLVSLGVTAITSVGFLVIIGLLGAGFLTPLWIWALRRLGVENQDRGGRMSGYGA